MHSSNSISGNNVSSNENDAMEWNEVLVEANNLTYYTHEMELRMQRYNAVNMASYITDSYDGRNNNK